MAVRSHSVTIALTASQVDEVLAAAGRAARAGPLVPLRLPSEPPARADPRLSRSLQRGLDLLARLQADGRERGIVELAAEAGMSPSTAHRYAQTLLELGLLERCPRTRRYRAAPLTRAG
jgi:hypothetical protein